MPNLSQEALQNLKILICETICWFLMQLSTPDIFSLRCVKIWKRVGGDNEQPAIIDPVLADAAVCKLTHAQFLKFLRRI